MKMVIQTLALAVVMGCGIPYAAGQAAPAPTRSESQAAAKPVADAAGIVERYRAEADGDGGRLS